MLCVLCVSRSLKCYAECHYAECHYAECRYAECRYAEYRYAECCGTVIDDCGSLLLHDSSLK